jgi:iron(II)-dependent oxidoreductase
VTTRTTDQAAGVLDVLARTRERTLALAGAIGDADLERQIDPLMSPLVWDLAHIAAYEDLWLVHRHAGEPLLRADLAATYDAFETPRAVRGEVELLDAAGARAYLADVRERTLWAAETHGIDPLLHELVLQHEQQHVETMLQTLALARLDGFDPPYRRAPPAVIERAERHTGLEFVRVPGGDVEIGAPADRFSYDNERPRQGVRVAPFRIGRTPVTNATWLRFAEGGGYERREWWSDEAWAWKEQWDITHPLHWERRDDGTWREHTACGSRDLDPDRPVCHVSWFEAAAFARANGARLPTEAEWEAAATWSQTDGATGVPWTAPGEAGAHLGQDAFDTAPVGAHPGGAADCGALDLIGNVWEWTSSAFDGYPGFVAHPYREYSEVFFGRGLRVLRGGSWATQARVATPTFRNWDLPERRQIFAGVRLAIDEEHAA